MSALRLSADEIASLNRAQRALLSPLAYEDPVEWQLQANAAVRLLVGADHSVFSTPTESGPTFLTDDTDPTVPDRFLSYCTGVEQGENRFRDPLLERAGRARRYGGTGAYHERMLASEDAIRRSVAYQEIFTPAGLTNLIGFSVPFPLGEATQFFSFEGPDTEARSERGLGVLQLLVPAFEAGVRMHLRRVAEKTAFTRVLDRVGQPLTIFSTAGVPLHRSDALRRLLDAEPEAERLSAVMHALARAFTTHRGFMDETAGPHAPRPCLAHVVTRATEYRLHALYLDPELLGEPAIAVVVERPRTLFPSIAELTMLFSLTRREAEVTLLLAEGLTDKFIAQRLGLSTNTARRYAERALGKLGIHSRAAVAVTLLRRGEIPIGCGAPPGDDPTPSSPPAHRP